MQELPEKLRLCVPPGNEISNAQLMEISTYLLNSFGNPTRIDYGTGHETNVVLFFLCLYKLQIIQESDLDALVLIVFPSYIEVMRKLLKV